MEGALGSRPSTTFRTLKIPKLRGQYFDMLLNMLYFKTYLTDSIARLKVLKLPLAIKSSAVRSRTSFWTKREFWGKLSMPIQTLKIPKLRGQYFDMLLNMFHIETYPTDSVHRAKGCNYLWPCHLRAVVNVGDCHAGSNCMEGALAGKLSMTFQTLKIPKLRGQYFDMLLNMFYLESYLKDGVARAKIVELPFRLDVFAVRSRTSVWRRSFGRNTFHDISNMQHTEALGPIFRYVAQYIIYRNISDGKRRTNKDCWITFEKELFCCSFQNVFLNEDGVLAGKLSMPIQTLKIPKLQANISICCSICSILNLIQRTASLEQRLLNYLWPCDLRAVVNVGTVLIGATAWRELWDRGPPRHFEHWKYPSYEANISICCSICYILKHIWRTASLA